jgi:hypothetical protein
MVKVVIVWMTPEPQAKIWTGKEGSDRFGTSPFALHEQNVVEGVIDGYLYSGLI